ncbi:hypothetical protein KM043_018467 [Ampulex compressa]|nr:hypothetical protein KM043_018467 [Ampulex compressa]
MKFTVVLICAVASGTIVLGDFIEDLASIISIPKERVLMCFEGSGLTMDELENEPNRESNPHYDEIMHKLGCFLHCVGEESGFFAGTKIRMPKVHQLIEPFFDDDIKTSITDKYKDIEQCGKLVRRMKDECEVAIHFIQCLQIVFDYNKMKEKFLLKP